MKNLNKEKMIKEFELMKEYEIWAGNFYHQVSLSPKIKDAEIRKTFEDTAKDESRHAFIIQKIINVINNNL
ncbi:MAG: ferritin family protein [bacterium]|nr:ferritin family protein [bacterium]